MSFDPHNHTEILRSLYQEILFQRKQYPTVYALLSAMSHRLLEAVQEENPRVVFELRSFLPALQDHTDEEVMQRLGKITLADCQWVIAKEYGYESWTEVEQQGQGTFDWSFEAAVDAFLDGEKEKLQQLLAEDPSLLSLHSPFWHQAGLIHYVGTNGVEMWRQYVGPRFVEMTQVLLDAGADPHMSHYIYGGNGDLVGLIATSAHPQDAGIVEELIQVVKSS